MLLPEDFREFIELMICREARFVMIGGYAYNLYRSPRATGDLSLFVDTSIENERRMRIVLTEFGFGSVLPPLEQRMLIPGKILALGRAPLRIDLLTGIDGVSFEEVYTSHNVFRIDGLEVPVISEAMLLKNKLASGRPKDLADAEELKQ